MESKNDRFVRLAESRVNSVIEKIHLISNLSNRRNYEYSKEEVMELFEAIEIEIQQSKKLFEAELSAELSKDRSKFKFSKKRG